MRERTQTLTTTTVPPLPGGTPEERALLVSLTVGYRIMRTTEVAPSWWGTPREVGETASVFVATQFCTEQNTVTMNPNNSKRIEFYAEPLYAATDSDPDADEALRRVRAGGTR